MTAHPYDEKTVARFWSKVNKNGPVPAHCPELGPCWVWTGAKRMRGYGAFRIGKQLVSAHRMVLGVVFAAERHRVVCHKCDNPACVCPEHLFIASQKENALDAIAKGRLKPIQAKRWEKGHKPFRALGQKNGRSKLTNLDISSIRERGGQMETYSQIARRYNISKRSVGRIIRREIWKHVP